MEPARALVCRHVAEGAPALLAARDELATAGGCEWRFLCGAERRGEGELVAVRLVEVVERDPSAAEIVLHPRGTALEREDAEGRWRTGEGPVLFPQRPSRRFPGLDPRYAPRPGEPLDAFDLAILADVAQHGFHVVAVAFEGEPEGHAFTVGLFRTHDHPEIAIFGLAPEEAAAAVARAAGRVRSGERLDAGGVAEEIVPGRRVAFRRIAARHLPAHLGHAVWYHGGALFPALQGLWADEEGHFPWDRWFPRELRDRQPYLFEPEPA